MVDFSLLMSDGPNADAVTTSSTELEKLTIAKLRLEIRQLERWWRSASHVGAAASIVVAVLGLLWAVTSGFFDVARRDLELRKRELEFENRTLQEKRDALTVRFTKEKREREATIVQLKRTSEALNDQLQRLGRPLVLDVFVVSAPWLPRTPSKSDIVVTFRPLFFGEKQPTVRAYVGGVCFGVAYLTNLRRDTSFAVSVVTWTPTDGKVRIPYDAVKSRILPMATHKGNEHERGCRATIYLRFFRADGKESNQKWFEAGDFAWWAKAS